MEEMMAFEKEDDESQDNSRTQFGERNMSDQHNNTTLFQLNESQGPQFEIEGGEK